MIKELIIKNFKGIFDADICFNKDRNVIVGNNGVGKSTIIEALSLVLGYGLKQLEVVPSLFNIYSANQFEMDKIPPEIIIEVYFDDKNDELAGTNNKKHEYAFGIQLKISFDGDTYGDLYEKEKNNCKQIPCEYYRIERNWFSDAPVIQRFIPYYVLLIDSSSSYFNSSSNQYIAKLLQRFIGEEETIRMKSGLRKLKDLFDQNEDLDKINQEIAKHSENLSLSIDVTSDIIKRNIICPYMDKIPVNQIGAGDLCILKTILALDKSHMTDKPRIVIIEEPESHLSHTKMYELLDKIESNIDKNDTQLIITTHNNFIANKLNLNKLILITNEKGMVTTQKITDNNNIAPFFTKVSNYPTLRLILSRVAILVEGPSDEIAVTYYYKKQYHKHPFKDEIELISVEGVKFKAFVELAKSCKKRVAVITDNDGNSKEELVKIRGLGDLPDSIKVFCDEDSINNPTLEPSFVHANKDKLQSLSDIVREKRVETDSEENLIEFMIKNKAEWAYRLLSKDDQTIFEVPKYIVDAVEWIREDDSNEQ